MSTCVNIYVQQTTEPSALSIRGCSMDPWLPVPLSHGQTNDHRVARWVKPMLRLSTVEGHIYVGKDPHTNLH